MPAKNGIYIAGPMTGKERYNKGTFDSLSVYLRAANPNRTIYSPAEHDASIGFDFDQPLHKQTGGWSLQKAWKWNIECLLYVCGEIVFLPGWERSKGCRLELAISQVLGLTLSFADRFDSKDDASWCLYNMKKQWPWTDRVDNAAPPTNGEDSESDEQGNGDIFNHARALVNGSRNQTYGHATKNFENIAAVWTVLAGPKLKESERFEASDVGVFMAGMKMCRLIASPGHYDSALDAIAYMERYWQCVKHARKEREECALTSRNDIGHATAGG